MSKKSQVSDNDNEFAYLSNNALYFDSACQSLRPQSVIDAMAEYYTDFNSCGERVKYKWGQTVDEKVEATRAKILKLLKLSSKDYFVSFTLNTTYGLNLLLSQLRVSSLQATRSNPGDTDGSGSPRFARDDNLLIKKVITSDIEHNSPFLATISFAQRHNLPREVLTRNDDGSIDLENADFTDSLVVMNSVSNIDGRQMTNIKDIAKKVKKQNGIFIIDAAQTLAHYHEILRGIEADAICFSSHKMYGPSLGAMVVRRDLLKKINSTFIGGGMVDDVTRDSFELSSKHQDHAHTAFEAGLQSYAEIIGLGAAIDFLNQSDHEKVDKMADKLFDFLNNSPKVHLINQTPTPTISFYHEKIDSHLLAGALSDAGVMARSGYFCCHYYLDHVKKYPPLLRLSLSQANRESDIDKLIEILGKAF